MWPQLENGVAVDTKATLISVWVGLGFPGEHRALLGTSLHCCRAWDLPEIRRPALSSFRKDAK